MKQHPKHVPGREPWSREEDERLRKLWKYRSFRKVCAKLAPRTPNAIYHRAKLIGLGLYPNARTLTRFCAETKYARTRVISACKKLGIKLKHAVPISPTALAKSRYLRIMPDQERRIIEFLKTYPDSKRLYSGAGLTPVTEWGTGGKPRFCKLCKTANHPHKAYGKCVKCHRSPYLATRGKWGVHGRPSACIDCGTVKRRHEGRGRCRPCGARFNAAKKEQK